MKKFKTAFSFFVFVSLLMTSNAQVNRRNTKKSVPYRANYQRIATGFYSNTSFEIRQGKLWAWGDNSNGGFGDGTTNSDSIPKLVDSDNTWITIVSCGDNGLGIKANGTLWAWGKNSFGELGDGTNTRSLIPKQIGSDDKWINVTVGLGHTLAIKADGTLWAWGYNAQGQLGIGNTTSQTSPKQVGSDTKWVKVVAGYSHTIALKADGTLWTWGENNLGQLGDGGTFNKSTPGQIGSEANWVDITTGYGHCTAIKSDGTLWAWGYNADGQLGDNSKTNRNSPVKIGTDNNWVTISDGYSSSFAIKSDGRLFAWGAHSALSNQNIVPSQIGTENNWISIAIGSNALGVKSNGSIWAWGDNTYGQIGDGTTINRPNPVQIRTAPDEWLNISEGVELSLGLKSDGSIWAWGNNQYGQFGDGTSNNFDSVPRRIGVDYNWVSISAGYFHNLALKSDGTLWSWGENSAGQLGNGTTQSENIQKQVGTNNNWVSISAGYSHSLALKSDGTLWAWGDNASGQLGDGTSTQSNSPIKIGSDNKWVSVKAANGYSLALKSDGTLWGWGSNSSGCLGDGSTTQRSSPIQIGTNKDWVCVSEGRICSHGIRSNGTLWGWGTNIYGSIGDGTTTDRTTPVQIGSDNKWMFIESLYDLTMGIKSDGILWGWGDNSYGELGDGTNTQRNNPVQIVPDINWVSISVGEGHSLGFKSDRVLYCGTGNNTSGQLGDGSTVSRKTFACNSACPPPSSPTTSNKTICSGNTTTLTASGSGVLSWYSAASGGNYLRTGANYTTPVLTTTTTVYVQDSTCAASNSRTAVVVTVNPSPTVTAHASALSLCAGSNATLLGNGANTYSWSDGVDDGVSFIPTTTKTYTVTGTDENNCSDTDTIKITVNPLPSVTATASSASICKGGSLTLTGASTTLSPSMSYSWTGGVNNGVSFIPTATNSYTVTGTDANNCSASDAITIYVNNLPTVTGSASVTTICAGASVTFKGSGANSYSWSNGITDNVPFTVSASATYTVTGTDANNCSSSDTVSIFVDPSIVTTVTAHVSAATVCYGASTTLSGQGTDSYSWSGGVTNNLAFVPLSSSSYTVTGTNNNGCSDTDVISIHVNNLPSVVAHASSKVSCSSMPITLYGSGANSYSWSAGVTNGVAFVPTVSKTYTLTGTDKNNCSNTDTITIGISASPAPVVKATASQSTVCLGTSTTLSGQGASTYSWNNGVTNGVAFAPDSSSTYTVKGTNASGCSDTASISIVVNPIPTVTIDASATTVCLGDSLTLIAKGANSYSWSDGISNRISFVPTSTHTYTVTGINLLACPDTATITIHVLTTNPPTVTAFASAKTICSGTSALLSGLGANSYSWSDGVLDGVSFIPKSTKTYVVKGYDSYGCSNTDTITITVKPSPVVKAHANNTTICFGDSVFVYGTSTPLTDHISYSWSNNIIDSIDFAPAQTQFYKVIGTNEYNCSSTDSVKITVYSFPLNGVKAFASDTIVCKGDSVKLIGTGADVYQWSGRVKNNQYFIPKKSTTYTLTGIVGNTCDNTSTITVKVLISPKVAALVYPSNAAVCLGDEVLLKGNSPDNVSYFWSHGITDSIAFVPTQDETYTVTASNGTTCTSQAVKAVRVLPLPVVRIDASATSICLGDSVVLKAIGAKTYFWSDNIVDSVAFSPTQTATYSVLGKNEFSCADTAMIAITVIDCDTTGVGINENNYGSTNVYPNPNNGSFTISVNDNSNACFSINNELGQIVMSFCLNNANNYSVQIDELNNGVYYLINNTGFNTTKIVVIK